MSSRCLMPGTGSTCIVEIWLPSPMDWQLCHTRDLRAVDLEGLIGFQLGLDERGNLTGTLGPLVGRGGRDSHLLEENDGVVQGGVMDVDCRVVSPLR
jgi:hypothetical protein